MEYTAITGRLSKICVNSFFRGY